MSLRINTNVVALSTYANLNINSDNLEHSINKLSSGLRITKAADDAAGLAISEKMRRQIRGLSRATLNAQDGISLIQTAEGALNETQSIIHRMRELAIQSANDTLTSNDRLEIQAEVDALKSQVDQIANSTEFNTKRLLNGNQAAIVSTSSTFVDGIVTGNAELSGDYKFSLTTLKGGISQIQRSQIFSDKNTGELAKGTTKLCDIDEFYDPNGVFVLSSRQILTINGNARTSTVVLDGKMTLNELSSKLQDAIGSESGLDIVNTKSGVISEAISGEKNNGGYIQIVSGIIGRNGDFSIAGPQRVMDSLGFSITRKSANNMISATIDDEFGNSRNIMTSNDKAVGLLEGIDIEFRSTPAQIAGEGGIVDGLRFDNNEEFNVVYVNTANATVTKKIAIAAGNWSLEGIARNINSQFNQGGNPTLAKSGFLATIQDGEIKISLSPVSPMQDSSFKITGIGSDKNTLGLLEGSYNGFVSGNKEIGDCIRGMSQYDTKKITVQISLKDGDIGPDQAIISVYKTTSDASAADLIEINQWVAQTNAVLVKEKVDARVDEVNGAMVFTSLLVGKKDRIDSKIIISANTTGSEVFLDKMGFTQSIALGVGNSDCNIHVVDTKPQFQIGAGPGETMQIGMGSMTCQALEIEKIDLTCIPGAEEAIEKLNTALDKVSHLRSQLGAYQNRLEYTISNLRNTGNNTSASESRIRDVDVASEMTQFTRHQVLTQAGTSMLAQANAIPQSALSLIQGM